MASNDRELDVLRARCTRFLNGHGRQDAARLLAMIPADTELDRYGEGGVAADLEAEVASLLGKPSAVFFPSGTMAQQSVLRVHADRRGRRTVGFHPACHVDRHEGRGYERLHALTGRPIGDPDRLLTLGDLDAVAEPLAALLLELPQRDLGGQQPAWEDLRAQAAWAREHGAAVHMDGARLWESAAGYGRAPGEVAALFDTVYVSFYKGIGALPGCCVAAGRHHRRGPGMAPPDGRHPVRPVAERGVRTGLPGPAAATDARLTRSMRGQSRPRWPTWTASGSSPTRRRCR